jgi:glycine hydroxymethyltransferase
VKYEIEDRVNNAVFPSLQGGPHENTIAGVAVALREAATPEFVEHIRQVKRNASTLAQALVEKGHSVVTGGTDNHLGTLCRCLILVVDRRLSVLWDVRPQGMTGSKLEKLFEIVRYQRSIVYSDLLTEQCSISVNKNAIYGDVSALAPGGVRLGAPAMTSRGLKEGDFVKVAEFLDKGMCAS